MTMALPHTLDGPTVRALVEGRHGDPFAVLGRHGRLIRTFQPGAKAVRVLDMANKVVAELTRIDDAGLFEGDVDTLPEGSRYRLAVDGRVIEDAYRFGNVLGEMDVYLLAEGRHRRLYEKLGAHPRTIDGVDGVTFAVWAPNATRCSVVGEFNRWDGRAHVMRKRIECGVFEIFVPGVKKGHHYKYELLGPHGELLPLKADPVGFRAEHPPQTASVVSGLVERAWGDQAWMAERQRRHDRHSPISIYEVHLGSWMRVPEEGGRYLSYLELAERLVPYVQQMGFTHIELLPISEYPFDGSWGYQPVGLFAPTIRHGTPDEFAAFVDACHQAGIGVIIDWVPGHFPSDSHGLAHFDGTALYEHADPRQGFHKDWNTLIYNYSRTEVCNFLIANALYWLDRFHIDGLRVDAVASMLYLDYSREHGEWIPNEFGGNENLGAIAFMRQLNELVYGEYPGAVTIAEESTAWPAVSKPTYLGGLGFGYKWNMGWMHDTLSYAGREPVFRRFHQNDLTFGMLYAFSENFILPLSHDEVVHGKGSLLGRMKGDRWQRFANLRAYFGFMWTHPGKKLLFMGGEFGQEREWNHDQSLDWHLLDDAMHRGMQHLMGELNAMLRTTAALYEIDSEWTGFEWIDASDSEQSVITYLRKAKDGGIAVVACNFTPVVRHGYRIGVPLAGAYAERLNTDHASFGGSGVSNGGLVHSEDVPWHGRQQSLRLTLPPLATLVLVPA
ncbi:MAG: 1,4-alpha-glucan branching protein GlgB [Geminicoccaceae bacterium]|nr:MAG: 1,4-alpha-glucan branching protein GlgB [Geminicoccaceae bacterium]